MSDWFDLSIPSPKCYFSFLFRKVKVAQSCLTLCDPMDYTVHGILRARMLEWAAIPFSGDLLNPGIEPRYPAPQAYSLSAEPEGKPKNTGVGKPIPSPADLPDPGIKPGLLHCRKILYQLRYQGSPVFRKLNINSRNPFGHDRICTNFSAGRKGRLEGCSRKPQTGGFHVIYFTLIFLIFEYQIIYLTLVHIHVTLYNQIKSHFHLEQVVTFSVPLQ